jgi:hypothetical protein
VITSRRDLVRDSSVKVAPRILFWALLFFVIALSVFALYKLIAS